MPARALLLSISLLALPALAAEEAPEPLLGVSTDLAAGQVIFEVTSSGCTAKADFRSRLEGAVLTLVRTRRDACKAMPHRQPLAFTLAELGLKAHQPFTLGNRLVVSEASAR